MFADKERILKDFTKEQILGLYLDLCYYYEVNEGCGSDNFSISPPKAQRSFDKYSIKLPALKHNRNGYHYGQVVSSENDEKYPCQKYYLEEFDEGILITPHLKIQDRAQHGYMLMAKQPDNTWVEVAKASCTFIKLAYEKVVEQQPKESK